MFDSCAHGFIAVTCPHCKHAPATVAQDDGDGMIVDMGSILERSVTKVENTGRRELRQANAELKERYA